MRRRDREIKEFDEIVKIIKKCDSLVLGLNDEGYPYLVPLNFGMDIGYRRWTAISILSLCQGR